MARHRNIKRLDIDEEYDDVDVIGHSVDENDMHISPSLKAQYLYQRDRLTSYPESDECVQDQITPAFESLSDVDKVRVQSCIEAVQNVVGETQADLFDLSLKFDCVPECVINEVLQQPMLKNPAKQSSDRYQGRSGPAPAVTVAGQGAAPHVVQSSRKVTTGFAVTNENSTSRSNSPAPSQQMSKLLLNAVEGQGMHSSSSSPSLCCKSPNLTSSRSYTNLEAAAKQRIKEKPLGGKDLINMVVIGHVDAGKSTLMGHLLYLLGAVNQRAMHKYKQDSQKAGKGSFAFAWVLDETSEERERGVTMDIAQASFETLSKQIVLLDAPGHKDFIPNMISGAAQADVAVLVINSTTGEFETGLDQGGQTREHTMLVRSLGVSQLTVAVNKLDTANWSKERYDEILEKMKGFLKQAGFPDVKFVPCCGLSGENLAKLPPQDHPLMKWYHGPCLLDVIDEFKVPERSVDKPLRFTVTDVYRGVSAGFVVSGKVETGAIQAGDKVVLLPNCDSAQVKAVQTDEGGIDAGVAYAGDHCFLTLANCDLNNLTCGHVICHPESPIPVSQCFQARVVIFNIALPITIGLPVEVHCHCACEPAIVQKLVSQLSKTNGEVLKNRPRCLAKNSTGVIELKTEKPLCIENYHDSKEMGRITLRAHGQTIAAGLVTKVVT